MRFWPLTQKQRARVDAVTAALVPSMVKACANCKWLDPHSGLDGMDAIKYAKCRHPNTILKDPSKVDEDRAYRLVTGQEPPKRPVAYDDMYCSTSRLSESKGRCGPPGRLWEPKE